MKARFTSTLFACLAVCTSLMAAPASKGKSNEPVSSKSKVFQSVLKTDAVRILSLELTPGEFLDFHSTPEEEVYAATDGTLRIVDAQGQEQTITVKAGDRLWNSVGQFKNWNTGTKSFKIVVLEKATAVL